MKSRFFLSLAALATVLAVPGSPLLAATPDLRAERSGADVILNWTGGVPEFRLYRAGDPATVVELANRIGETTDGNWLDTPPAGQVWFYRVESGATCYPVNADTYIDPALSFMNFGGEDNAQVQDTFSPDFHTYVRFQLAGIPSGARIDDAVLELNVSEVAGDQRVEVRPALGAWDEMTLSSDNAPPSGAVITTDLELAPVDSWKRFDVLPLVQDWVDGVLPNDGFVLGPDGTGSTYVIFYTREHVFGPSARLCVEWSDPQERSVERLAARSVAAPDVDYDGEGRPVAVRADVEMNPAYASDPVLVALAYLEEFKGLYLIDDPQADTFLDGIRSWNGVTSLYFGQRHPEENIVAWGSSLVVRVIEGTSRVVGTMGVWKPELPLEGLVLINSYDAALFAEAEVPGQFVRYIGEPRLYWFERDLVDYMDLPPRPAWRVGVKSFDPLLEEFHNSVVFVDAENGSNLLLLDDAEEIGGIDPLDYAVRQADTMTDDDCWKPDEFQEWFNTAGTHSYPGEPEDSFSDAAAASALAIALHDAIANRFQYSGWDDGTQQVVVMTDADRTRNATGCKHIRFTDGSVVRDLFGHEYMHAIDSYNSGTNLIYRWQSGALDEAFADTFATYYDEDDWLLGEDLPSGIPVRDISNPIVDHMDDFRITEDDNGAVHRNSGIITKAYVLLVDGGTNNGIVVNSLDHTDVEQMFWDVHFNRGLPDNALFTQFRTALWVLATEDYSANDACQIARALHSVGLGANDANCDGLPEYPPDVDADGVPNSTDNCLNVFNPGQADLDMTGGGDVCDADLDGDGIDNSVDNCIYLANTDQEDIEVPAGDGVGDACEDLDADDVPFEQDNCRSLFNPSQWNSDSDGRGNLCDNDDDGDGIPDVADFCPLRVTPTNVDMDGDGVGDQCDNCPSISNSAQENNDRDADGDACDLDDDNDGRPDTQDNCPFTKNFQQIDTDEDGIGMACDLDEILHLDGLQDLGDLIVAFEYMDVDSPLRFPIAPCGATLCPDTLPEKFFTTVTVDLQPPLHARIVDDEGTTVATTSFDPSGQHSMQFRPATDYHYLSPAIAELPFDGQAATQAVRLRSYFLELHAPSGSSPMTVEGAIRVRSQVIP